MRNIIETSELPEGEKVFLKKDFFGEWHVVYPLRNPDGKFNWFRFLIGSKFNLIITLLILFGLTMFYIGYKDIMFQCKAILENPCKFCISNFIP